VLCEAALSHIQRNSRPVPSNAGGLAGNLSSLSSDDTRGECYSSIIRPAAGRDPTTFIIDFFGKRR
jgi:hypothetical protein